MVGSEARLSVRSKTQHRPRSKFDVWRKTPLSSTDLAGCRGFGPLAGHQQLHSYSDYHCLLVTPSKMMEVEWYRTYSPGGECHARKMHSVSSATPAPRTPTSTESSPLFPRSFPIATKCAWCPKLSPTSPVNPALHSPFFTRRTDLRGTLCRCV